MSIDFDYIFLNILVLFVFYICGNNISKGQNYFFNSLICCIVYVFVIGSRYGRGADYLHYIDVFKYDLEKDQIVYTWFTTCLKDIGITAYQSFYYYAFVFIVCALYLFRNYALFAKYIFPLFVIATINIEETFIRQALSFAFIYIILSLFHKYQCRKKFFTKKKIISVFVAIFIIFNIHYVNILFVILFFVLVLFYHKPFPLKLSIPIYLLAVLVLGQLIDLSNFNFVFSYLGSINEKFAGYYERSDQWFSSYGMEDKYVRNPIILGFEACGNVSLIYLGYNVIKRYYDNNTTIISIYNMYIIGAVILNTFRTLELLNRTGLFLQSFFFLPLALVLCFRKRIKDLPYYKVSVLFLVWWSYDYLKYLFVAEDTLFLWDINKF